MDIALVTGADAGPGLAIARRLIGLGCRVYALATQFARNPFPHDDFLPISCDLADPAALTKVAEDIVAREGHVSFVVHAARRAPVSLLDTPVAELAARVNTGLVAPLALARATLPWLRKEQGHFIVLCWNGDGPAPGGPVTAAIEGGLHHFAEALFDELRNDGVRATTVYARANPETTPEAAMALDPQSAINPELVADAVENLLRLRPSNAISEIVIRPAATAETPRLLRSAELAGLAARDVQLPARQNFPQEPEPIPTPRAARPSDAPPDLDEFDDEDEDEDEDFEMESDAAPADSDRDGPSGPPRQGGQQSGPRHYDDQGQGGGRGGRGRRRRGRGGRGRGRGPFNDRPPQGGGPRGPAPAQGQPPPRDYPDAEAETEQRTFSRDDSFRTPHSDADEDNGGEPHDADRGDAPDARDDSPREDSHRGEPAPVHAEAREEFSHGGGDDAPSRENREPRRQAEHHDRGDDQGRRGDDNRRSDHGQRPPQHSGNRPSQQGGGPRRHRGYGRRPPPSAGPSRDRE